MSELIKPLCNHAYVVGQAALLNAKVASMQAANLDRANRGLSPAYGEEQFDKLISEYDPALSHNGVLSMEWYS